MFVYILCSDDSEFPDSTREAEVDDDDSEGDDEEESDEEPDAGVIRATADIAVERCTVAYRCCLKLLAELAPRTSTCACGEDLDIQYRQKGTALYMTWVCKANLTFIVVQYDMYVGNPIVIGNA